jgi:hypothetical protein
MEPPSNNPIHPILWKTGSVGVISPFFNEVCNCLQPSLT